MARDLTQETLLSALMYISRDNQIKDVRGWLLTVMNRKFYDILRRRYKQPFVSLSPEDNFDIADDSDAFEAIGNTSEGERVRREVAFLASIYREVVVRHYMDSQRVASIAKSIGIPEGTVKSRLSSGRTQMKKNIITPVSVPRGLIIIWVQSIYGCTYLIRSVL